MSVLAKRCWSTDPPDRPRGGSGRRHRRYFTAHDTHVIQQITSIRNILTVVTLIALANGGMRSNIIPHDPVLQMRTVTASNILHNMQVAKISRTAMLVAETFNCYKDDHLYLPSNGTTSVIMSSRQQSHDSDGTIAGTLISPQQQQQVLLARDITSII